MAAPKYPIIEKTRAAERLFHFFLSTFIFPIFRSVRPFVRCHLECQISPSLDGHKMCVCVCASAFAASSVSIGSARRFLWLRLASSVLEEVHEVRRGDSRSLEFWQFKAMKVNATASTA